MRKLFLYGSVLILVAYVFESCHSSEKAERKHKTEKRTNRTESKDVSKVIKTALSYEGTKYKYGGITKKGIDCSGLMYVSFKEVGIELPRSSTEQSRKYNSVKRNNIQKGDLIFFATGNDKNKISHVGLVIEVSKQNDVNFIHATTQRGVCKDWLSQAYYKDRFVKVVRVF